MTEAAVQPASLGQETSGTAVTERPLLQGPVFGPGALFIFAASAIGVSFSGLLPFTWVAEVWPGANLALIILVALVAALIHAYTFAAIGSVGRMKPDGMPAAGDAGWKVAGRALDTPLAFASSWVMAVFLALGSGVVVGTIFTEVLPHFARGLAMMFESRWLLNNLPAFTTQEGVAMFGTFGVLLVFLFLFISPQVTNRILMVGLLLTGLGWIIICVQLASATPYSFQLAWDKYMGTGVFVYQLKEARAMGLQTGFNLQAILTAGLAVGMLLFSGFFLPSYFASEAKAPQKNLLRSGVLAVVTCGALLLGGVFAAQRIIPLEWFSAQAILSQLPQYYSSTLPWLPFYAAILHPNLVLFWVVGVSWIFGLLCLAVALAYTASRILRGWASGGFLPDGVGFMHPELRSPLISVLLVCILVEAGLVAFALGISTKIWLPLAAACAQIVPVLALIRLPYRHKDLFEQSGTIVNRKIGPLPLVTVTGIISLVFLLAVIAFLLLSPKMAELNANAGIALLVVFVLGMAWYFLSQPYRSQPEGRRDG